eukprot:746185-Hanusia_phi.AAC.1
MLPTYGTEEERWAASARKGKGGGRQGLTGGFQGLGSKLPRVPVECDETEQLHSENLRQHFSVDEDTLAKLGVTDAKEQHVILDSGFIQAAGSSCL